MLKNVSGQKVGVQMVSATDGSAFTGSVTVAVTGDAGTQATGSVGSGACTHEGHGYHTYAPAQAETNYDLIAFTFTGTGAVPATVQVYPLPTTGILAPATAGRTLVVDASGLADANAVKVGPSGSGTAQTAKDLGAINVTNLNTLSSHDPGATLGTSTLTQTQVTGGAYALNSASFSFNSAMDFTTTQKAATLARVTLVDTLTTYTSNTPQTGDSYAIVNSGTHGNAAIKGYVDDIGVAGAGLTAIPDSAGLTTLLGKFTGITLLAQWLGLIAGKQTGDSTARTELRATGAGSGTFDETTDSIEALRDRGDAAWVTATGFSTLDAAGIRTAVGLASANLDTQLGDLDDAKDTVIIGTVGVSPSQDSFTTDLPQGADLYNDRTLEFITSAGGAELVGESRVITDTSGASSPVLSFDEAFITPIVAGSTFKVRSRHTHSKQQLVDAILDEPGSFHTTALTIGALINSAGALLDLADGIETDITLRQALRLILAASAGKLSGAATTTIVIRNVGDSKDRITATVDADGNRSAVTTDAT